VYGEKTQNIIIVSFRRIFAEALNTLKEERPALKVDWAAPVTLVSFSFLLFLTFQTAFALLDDLGFSGLIWAAVHARLLYTLRHMCKT
jgi:hypothetical protein